MERAGRNAHALGYLVSVLGRKPTELGLAEEDVRQILDMCSHSYNEGLIEGRRDCRPTAFSNENKTAKVILYKRVLGLK